MDFRTAITVDVGWATGLAFWNYPSLVPHMVKGINITTALAGASLELKLQTMGEYFNRHIEGCFPDIVVIEGTSLWSGSEISHASASTGNLFQAAYLVGVYAARCFAKDIKVKIVTVNQWKGQLTKKATQARISRAIGKTYPSTHQTDAVGIGLSILYGAL